jgi:hypothetical protein
MKDNKAAQTIVGALVLYVIFKLWSAGYFSPAEESEGFSNTDLWLAVGSAILSFVQLVGLISISIALKLLPAFETMANWAAGQIKGLIEKAKESISQEKKAEGSWDWRPLAMVILSYLLWSGGQLAVIWERIKDVVPNAVEVISDKPIGILFSVDKSTSVGDQWLTAKVLKDDCYRVIKMLGVVSRGSLRQSRKLLMVLTRWFCITKMAER